MEHAAIDQGRLAKVMGKLLALTSRSESGCWLWTGYTQPNGYGWINVAGVKIAAHRAALLNAGVVVPDDMDVCHRCDVRACVNPKHLYVGSRRQNMADCTERSRHNKPTGERHWCAKISSSDVAAIREQRKKGVTTVALAKTYSVNPATISRIARGIWRTEVSL